MGGARPACAAMPHPGRDGRVENTRELIAPRLPYLAGSMSWSATMAGSSHPLSPAFGAVDVFARRQELAPAASQQLGDGS